MPILIMLSLYFGLLICTLLYLHKTNQIKLKTKTKAKRITKRKPTLISHGYNNAKHRLKWKQKHD